MFNRLRSWLLRKAAPDEISVDYRDGLYIVSVYGQPLMSFDTLERAREFYTDANAEAREVAV